jgi:hypothetical protein
MGDVACDGECATDADMDIVGTYCALAERCASTVTGGGYLCELFNLRVSNNNNDDDEGGGGGGLPENVARMERDCNSELRKWEISLLTSLAFTIPLAILHFTSMQSMDGGEDEDMTTAMHEDLLPSVKDWSCLLLALLVQFGIHAYFIILSFLYTSSLGCNSISFSIAGDGKMHHHLGGMRL